MFELVPSEYMREVFRKNNYEFSDFNKATIIWNRKDVRREERISALKELAVNTEDQELKQQILDRLYYEDSMLKRHKNNKNKKCVYVVLDSDECGCGYFSDYDMAYEYGKEIAAHYDEDKFSIEKQYIISEEHDMIVRSGARTNPYMFNEKVEPETEAYSGEPLSVISFYDDGQIKRIWSNEMSLEEEEKVDSFRPDRFEHQFFKIPFEGEKGMVVRDLTDCSENACGILMQDTEGWNRHLIETNLREAYLDYSDISVIVVFLNCQGRWVHEHINPIYLEAAKYPDLGTKKSEAMQRAIVAFSEYQQKKTEGVDDISQYEKKVIRLSKEYSEAYFEAEKESNQRMYGWKDWGEL